MPADCTPSANLSTYKCLACLSTTELLMLLVVILADAGGTYTLPDDLSTLMQDAACWGCLSDKQLLQASVSALAQDIEADATLDEIRAKIACLKCANPGQIKSAIAMLICQNSSTLTPA